MSVVVRTLVDLLNESAQRWPELPAVRLDGEHGWGWTYRQLWDAALATVEHLCAEGVRRGDRVLIWGPNGPEWAAGFFAVQLAGAIAVPLDLRSPDDVLLEIQHRAEPAHALAGVEQMARLNECRVPATSFTQIRAMASDAQTVGPVPAALEPEDIAELVFTSGTTGTPKGVILTQRNLVANVLMCRPAFPTTPKHRVVSILPLSHMFEQMGGLLVPLSGGASITYVSALRPDAIFAAMANVRVTNMTCVPQVLALFREGIEREIRRQGRGPQFARAQALAGFLPRWARRMLFRQIHERIGGALDYIVCGGAYLDPELARWWERLGIKLPQGYGMTEAAPVVAANTLRSRDRGSVGRPLPGVQVKIAADHEILVRGENVTPGYWRDPEATAAAFADGWYRTGDLGSIDRGGRLHLQGRVKNIIVLANGLNVYPEDLEHVLVQDPRVKDAVVLGLQDGQDVEVHAVLLTEHADEASEIVRRANARLGPQQQIRRYSVWPDETFPMTPTLKPRRGEIAARLDELKTR
jgi:long-chain acyl-CoA synthetase